MEWTLRKENNYTVLVSGNKDTQSFIFDNLFLQCIQESCFNYLVQNYLENPLNQYYATVRFND